MADLSELNKHLPHNEIEYQKENDRKIPQSIWNLFQTENL